MNRLEVSWISAAKSCLGLLRDVLGGILGGESLRNQSWVGIERWVYGDLNVANTVIFEFSKDGFARLRLFNTPFSRSPVFPNSRTGRSDLATASSAIRRKVFMAFPGDSEHTSRDTDKELYFRTPHP